ncbi:hypothetical protein [Streptomyces microflavus]|uniref:Uncharacterized protein n=1 Tax=Streptomyces microflavus TaxID=1919 RepID=A0A7H8N2A7_STRMI|nr:hypothetical protein [Streptomyces microflavus]QKW48128.1 hypothetical protein HUT09_36965 [Streptomyces microflavus]
MIQHMNLVFQAGGLKTGEGAFLMACANHTDDRGYVIAHMKQIADEAHMTLRAAQDNRARLEARGLLKTKERLNPKNKAQIANLFRINLDKLAAMKRSKTDYGPTLIEELTFDAADVPSEEKPSSDPHADSAPPPADSAPPHAESAGGGGAESAPLLLPSSSPSSLSGPGRPPSDGSEQGEREAAAPEDAPAPTGAGGVPGQREDTDGSKEAGQISDPPRETDVSGEAVTMLVGLPGTVTEAAARRLVPLVLAAVAAGWTLPGLRAHLARLCDPGKVRYAPAVYEKHLRELPAAPAVRPARGTGARYEVGAGMCARHLGHRADDCTPCDREARGGDPAALRAEALAVVARVRASLSGGGR